MKSMSLVRTFWFWFYCSCEPAVIDFILFAAGASNSESVLVPLTFPQELGKKTADPANEGDEPVECMLCSEEFQMQCNQTGFLQHLFTIHRLVIGDVQQVASLKRFCTQQLKIINRWYKGKISSYANFWKVRLRSGPMEEFCTVMLMDVTPDGEYSPDETYYLLSDVLPEDRELREGLQEKRLVISYKKGWWQ